MSIMGEQVQWSDLAGWSGKMSPEPSAVTEEKTYQPSLKKRSKSSNRKPPLFLCLTKDGLQQDACLMWTENGALLGEYTMHSFGECPREENVSRLSAILEECPHPKYSLSVKACQGILRRGKKLPEQLEAALRFQSTTTGDHNAHISDYTAAICIGNGQAHIASHITEEVCQTLNCMHDPMAVLVAGCDFRNNRENGDLCGTLQAKSNGGQSLNYIHPVRVNQTVRRLTPLECERLQDYPDGWTDIGEWTDSKGKKHKAADSPRYKAIGNSIALPFWFWLLRRISAQYERPATLGSLFDGIGGFPLCWERCNGKGTALWASEIEEFPMAVTKIRFSSMEQEAR